MHRSIQNILGVRIQKLSPLAREIGFPLTTDGGPLQRTYGPWYEGEYDAMILSLDTGSSSWYRIAMNYTLADATDNLLNSTLALGIATQGARSVPTDNLDVDFDRGPSDLSVRHSFVAFGHAELPWDIAVSAVAQTTSGVYFSAAGLPIDYDGDGDPIEPTTWHRAERVSRSEHLQFRFPCGKELSVRHDPADRVTGRVLQPDERGQSPSDQQRVRQWQPGARFRHDPRAASRSRDAARYTLPVLVNVGDPPALPGRPSVFDVSGSNVRNSPREPLKHHAGESSMNNYRSLNHTKWECQYHVVFIPKYRRKTLYGGLRHYLGDVLRRLAEQRESRVEEGHLLADHVHMLVSIPPKYSVAQVIGYIKGKSAIHIAREFAGRPRNFVGQHFWARGYYVSTVGQDERVVREYVQQQEREDRRLEQLRLEE